MLNGFIALPLAARMACVFFVSIIVARFINWAIYNWAYTKSAFGPWAAAPKKFPAHTLGDHLPALGWWRLRRESKAHKKLFWLRPMLLEIIFPVACAWYYHFYVSGGVLGARSLALAMQPELHTQFLSHYALFILMAIATFIDFDEFSIPDYITVPGAVIGIVGAAFAPAWLPMSFNFMGGGTLYLELLATNPMPDWLLTKKWSLLVSCGIIVAWALALQDRRWIGRRGLAKALQYFFVKIGRNREVILLAACASILMIIVCVWAVATNSARVPYLLSSLIGLAFAGGITWGVRIAATWGLQIEALGFGDVTLMAMIGTFIGWQASLLVFFIAPMLALGFAVVRWIATGDIHSPYGPYLCGATVVVLVWWDALWNNWAGPVFVSLGGLVIVIVATCIVMMGGMLWVWRLIKQMLGIDFYSHQ